MKTKKEEESPWTIEKLEGAIKWLLSNGQKASPVYRDLKAILKEMRKKKKLSQGDIAKIIAKRSRHD